MERQQLLLVPIGGLANRIYAITSAIAFCEDHDIDLKVVWFKDWGMGADFHALFELAGDHPHVEIVDATWKDYIYDRPRKRNFWLPYLYQKLAFDKRFYEKELYEGFCCQDLIEAFNISHCIYLVNCSSFYIRNRFNTVIIPNDRIEKYIREKQNGLELKHCIGVHIRRSDNAGSTLNSPFSLFIEKMDQELIINPDALFYVASDSLKEKQALIERYGHRIITDMRETSRDNKQGIEDAVIDLYSLSMTSKIYGSACSSFSSLAANLGNIPLEILSI